MRPTIVNALKGTDVRANEGYPGEANYSENPPYSSGAKAENVLGIKYVDLKTSAYDTAKSLLERFPQ